MDLHFYLYVVNFFRGFSRVVKEAEDRRTLERPGV
jgi:hypothetical protein